MNKSKIEWCDYTPHTRNPVVTGVGYVWVWCPEHPNSNKGKRGHRGYIAEHRLVMSNALKRPLCFDEHVHHINGNKADNRIENLELLTNSNHRKIHNGELSIKDLRDRAIGLVSYAAKRKKPRSIVFCECGCGGSFVTPDINGRVRKFLRGHNAIGKHWKWRKNNATNTH